LLVEFEKNVTEVKTDKRRFINNLLVKSTRKNWSH